MEKINAWRERSSKEGFSTGSLYIRTNKKEKKMNSNRKSAIIVGVLFITATVATIISQVFLGSILDAQNFLVNVSSNENPIIIGALFMLIDAVAVAAIAILLYPVLKKHNVSIALGYVGARIVECVLFIIVVLSTLSLLTLSLEFIKAGAPSASYFQTGGTLLLAASDWAFELGLVIFALSALLLNYSLYKSKLVPRWLSVWGFIGAALVLALHLLKFFNINLPEVLDWIIGLQEMVFAVWLIVKGFNSSAIVSGSA